MKEIVGHVYAIIRIDEGCVLESLESKITVTRIVWDAEKAEAEVQRLNKLNSEKGYYYFWKMTRLTKNEQ